MLTSKQRAYLRGLANTMDPILHAGKGGTSDTMNKQADDALTARELIKGRVYSDILTTTGASSATISRVNRMLRDGHGRLGEMLDRAEADKTEE